MRIEHAMGNLDQTMLTIEPLGHTFLPSHVIYVKLLLSVLPAANCQRRCTTSNRTLHASEPTQALLPPPYPSTCWGVRLWHAKPAECQPLATDLAFQSMRRGWLLHECSRPKDCGTGATLSGAHRRMRTRHL